MSTKIQDPENFDAAFAEFALPEKAEKTEEKPVEEAKAEEKPAEEKPTEAVVEEKPAEEKPAVAVVEEVKDAPAEGAKVEEKPAEEKPVEAAPAAVVEEKPAPAATDDLLARLAELVKEKPAEEKKGPVEEKVEEPLYSKDEQEQIDNYLKEWPEVAAGAALQRKGEYRELVGYIFSEVAKVLSPLKETSEALAERSHFSELREVVPDYSDTTRDEVIGWVGKQPTYLQKAYNEVIQTGTVEEVADLIDRFRKATGKGAPDPKTSEKKEPELSEEAKKAALALAPVSSERTVVQAAEDMSNFDAAFATYAKETDQS